MYFLNFLFKRKMVCFEEKVDYGDLVYKFRKIIGKNDFPYHFKKITVR